MQTIQPIQTDHATGSTKRLIETVKVEGGTINNMIKTMAHSPNVLEGYLHFRSALAAGQLSAKTRERIALTVAQANRCAYSLAQHTVLGRQQGLTEDEIVDSREARAADEEIDAVLKFANNLATRGGEYSPAGLRHAGYSDAEIVEIVAYVSLNLFVNYFNLVANTQIDFPVKAKAA